MPIPSAAKFARSTVSSIKLSELRKVVSVSAAGYAVTLKLLLAKNISYL